MAAEAEIIPLGSRLRQRREELGLSQAQAARQLDVARTAYRLWEMEAAKPAPDRWRSIARWLGISMNALLFAEQLIDQQESAEATHVADAAGMSDLEWDVASDISAGDFFSQERAMIEDNARSGSISRSQAMHLNRVLSRVQRASLSDRATGWYPGTFRKRFPCDALAPALARSAVATTVIGIAVNDFETAALLTSELVTNSVRHTESEWIDVAITMGIEVLRIEVSDQSTQSIRPRTPGAEGGWGLALVGELATRWGVERHEAGKTVWLELDLMPSE